MQEQLISIVLPTYNRQELLPRAVYSVFGQTWQNWELLIVDDGSTDATEELCRSFGKEDARVRYIGLSGNHGPAFARNRGIEQAKGDYIAFLDSDDEWLPTKLDQQVRAMTDRYGVCYCNYEYYDVNEVLLGVCPAHDIDEILKSGKMLPQLLVMNMIGTPTMLVRKSCLEEVGGFLESLGCLEDYELVLRLAARYEIVHVNDDLVQAHASADGVSGNVNGYFDALVYIYHNYYDTLEKEELVTYMRNRILEKAELFDRTAELKKRLERPGTTPAPKVSVIVPCFNAAAYLRRCLEHLVHQTIGIENIQLILVDDASTDGGATMEIITEYESAHPDQIIVIPLKENMRQGGARNAGLLYATGEYILFCDADDWIADHAIRTLYDIAKEQDCDVVEFGNRDVYRDAEAYDREASEGAAPDAGKEDTLHVIDTEAERKRWLLSGKSTHGCWNKLYRTELIQVHGIHFAEQVSMEEPSFTYLVRFFEKRHYFRRETLHYCLQHEGSTMRSPYEPRKWDNAHATLHLYEQIGERALDEAYKEETRYLFWYWYFHSSLLLAAQYRTFFTREEFIRLQEKTKECVGDIRDNPYFKANFKGAESFGDVTYCDSSRIGMDDLYDCYRQVWEQQDNGAEGEA